MILVDKNDPLAPVVDWAREGTPIPLAWVVRWSEGGIDPLRAAFDASMSPGGMLIVAQRASREAFARSIWETREIWMRQAFQRELRGETLRLAAKAIHKHHSGDELPTLAELLASEPPPGWDP